METLPKIAIILGMVIGVTFFGMIMFMMIPDMIDHNRWDRVTVNIDEEELTTKFLQNESYKIFIEKYPENGETMRFWDDGGELRVNAMNFTSLTKIDLELRFDARDDNFRINLDCRNDHADWRLRIDGPLAAKFLENVDCLAIEKFTGKNSELVYFDGNADAAYATSNFSIIAD